MYQGVSVEGKPRFGVAGENVRPEPLDPDVKAFREAYNGGDGQSDHKSVDVEIPIEQLPKLKRRLVENERVRLADQDSPETLTEAEIEQIVFYLSPDGPTTTEVKSLPFELQQRLLKESQAINHQCIGYLPPRNVIGEFTRRVREEADAQKAAQDRERRRMILKRRREQNLASMHGDTRFGKGRRR